MKATCGMIIILTFIFGYISVGNAQWGTANFLVDGWKASKKIDAGRKDVESLDFLHAGVYAGYLMELLHGTVGLYKIPVEVTPGQIFTMVGKYLDEHPEKWSEPPYKLVSEAIFKAFPK